MFVSTYNTYVSATNSTKDTKQSSSVNKEDTSFSSKFSQQTQAKSTLSPNIPIDYVEKNKSFFTKLNLENQDNDTKQLKEIKQEFTSHKTLFNAKQAYSENAKIFSLIKLPQHTIDQIPKIDKKLPTDIQEIKEKKLRHIMVNTYIQNDRYFQITA